MTNSRVPRAVRSVLAVAEVLLTGAEDVPDAVERVVAAPAVTGRLLLDAAADVINDRSGELHDMERVEHGDGVLELVVDGVLVAVERVEGGDLDAGAEGLTPLDEPGPVGLSGAAGHQVQQAGVDLSVLVTSEVDHAGELLGAPPAVLDGSVRISSHGVNSRHVAQPCGDFPDTSAGTACHRPSVLSSASGSLLRVRASSQRAVVRCPLAGEKDDVPAGCVRRPTTRSIHLSSN